MEPVSGEDAVWRPERRPWGWADLAALLLGTAILALFFRDAVGLRGALFYFDINEINYPYRDFVARELRAGRFSRWHPGLYCGLPLYSESQAGYLHPFKYLLYPWLPTWQAFNLDTVLSVWLTGLGTYGWLRRHVGIAGALTGAAAFGLSGYVWAHLIHTSMINALASVPFIFWALESAWGRGRWWPVVLGAVAMACQVFAGHLQDTILTAGAVGLYGLYRAATASDRKARLTALAMPAALGGLAIALSAVQWVPSKELLDRSPRAGGLTWLGLTHGSWHPELLPTLVVREAYGTRARDTDWMDGYYPYQEMNAYMGVIAMALAVVGAAAYRDRWVAFWVLLTGLGALLMLGRFTVLLDAANRVPVLGSSRIPVRFHLWVSLGVAALAAVGVDRLARPGTVRLRGALLAIGGLVLVSIPIALYIYEPAWAETSRWPLRYHRDRFGWLRAELAVAVARTVILAALAWTVAHRAARSGVPGVRRKLAALLPALVVADLLGAHGADVPTIDPAYWTDPPQSARLLKADPACQRMLGLALKSSGEPGYASEPVDFFAVRDTLDWSLPPVWGLSSARGETPIHPRRLSEYNEHVRPAWGKLELEGITHVVTGWRTLPVFGEGTPAGKAFIHRIPDALPRVRLAGRPLYADDERAAVAALDRLGPRLRDRLIVEDPDRPLPEAADVSGTAAITRERPERVEVAADAGSASYLVLTDTFDPGWSAALDGRPVPIRPAYVAFRAVFLPKGRHTVVFTYRPAGFRTGLGISAVGVALALGLLACRPRSVADGSEHGESRWPRRWPWWGLAAVVVVMAITLVGIGPTGMPTLRARWSGSVHRFTWGAGIEAMKIPQS